MFCNNIRLSFFACQKDAAGAGASLKKAAPAKQKFGSGSTLKVAAPGGSGPATLNLQQVRGTFQFYF